MSVTRKSKVSEEIISLCYGQAGCQIGKSIWDLLCAEHNIDREGVRQDNTDLSPSCMFYESTKGDWVPRCLFIDTEATIVDSIRSSNQNELHHPSHFIHAQEDASNCYARGRYVAGFPILRETIEQIRQMVEMCNLTPQAFMQFFSVGGGTGSGFSALLRDSIKDSYFNKTNVLGMTIFPSPQLSTSIVEPHNTMFGTVHSVMKNDLSVVYDNEALYKLFLNKIRDSSPSYVCINQLIAQTVSSLTQSMRLESENTMNIREFALNMVPFPNINLIAPSWAPLCSRNEGNKSRFDTNRITQEVLSQNNYMACVENGMIFSTSVCYKGDNCQYAIHDSLLKFQEANWKRFCEYCPRQFKVCSTSHTMVNAPNTKLPYSIRSATAFVNTSAVMNLLGVTVAKSSMMWPAFSCWYTENGVRRREYEIALTSIQDLISSYSEILPEAYVSSTDAGIFMQEVLAKIEAKKDAMNRDPYEYAGTRQLWTRTEKKKNEKKRKTIADSMEPDEAALFNRIEDLFDMLNKDKKCALSPYNIYHVENFKKNESAKTLAKIYEMQEVDPSQTVTEMDVKQLFKDDKDKPQLEKLEACIQFCEGLTKENQPEKKFSKKS